MEEQFLFDDFFVSDNDPGIETTILVRGRHIPLRIRPLSMADQVDAQSQALSKRLGPDGSLVIDNIDEKKATGLLLAKSIVSWPFKHKDGSPVEVTPENCSLLLGEAGQQIMEAIGKLAGKRVDAIAPFASSSDAA